MASHQKTQWDQDIGPPVSFPSAASRPGRVELTGKTVTLQPLAPRHALDLWPEIQDEKTGHIWTYMGDEPYRTLEAFQRAVTTKSESTDLVFSAIINNQTHKAVGWASYMRIDPTNRVMEVGNILFSPSLQRTKAATEAMYLMMKHAFEDLGYRRYEWKCDNHNRPSKRAALRFGFTFEGVFRQHIIYKGRSRDTAWFSIIDTEWPTVKNAFEKWLDDSNFDDNGTQLHRLEDFRDAMPAQKGPITLEGIR
ncbi:hypothetical protein PV08_09589 [Exophiala spinifera]|uniref:N-acetyltransferase domain-containing protein n=1 Tax=Exophiala spinifera TaxID=91928 RepID=A0A0D1ZHA0_9EURO|nr:uncharacterized protein PV08_09589 [Exophiala spinifera]KIW12312.1 hypothetical protein PV08_09589 [Exophiala spinifera]